MAGTALLTLSRTKQLEAENAHFARGTSKRRTRRRSSSSHWQERVKRSCAARDGQKSRGTPTGVDSTCVQGKQGRPSRYRYEWQRNAEDEPITDWLPQLPDNNRNWGFRLYFRPVRNVKSFGRSHKRVCRIYRELELNPQINPGKCAAHEVPEPSTTPLSINAV